MPDEIKYNLDWADFAFASKKPVNDLNAYFIYAPRDISVKRFKQLIKNYLIKGNLILGISKDKYVAGFELQPQFKMLDLAKVEKLIEQVNKARSDYKIYTLSYFQRESKYVLDKLDFKKILLVNGSWKYSFHTQEPFYVIAKRQIDFKYISPFYDEIEAKQYALETDALIAKENPFKTGIYGQSEMMEKANIASTYSYDFTYQTGVTLGKKTGGSPSKFNFLGFSFNIVVPYQSYAMHFGAQREVNYSPPNDLNYYDTVHAEVMMLIKAGREKIDLSDTSLFINLLPCPTCTRMFCETDISEFYYLNDHSDGYGLKMLTQAGKKVVRLTI